MNAVHEFSKSIAVQYWSPTEEVPPSAELPYTYSKDLMPRSLSRTTSFAGRQALLYGQSLSLLTVNAAHPHSSLLKRMTVVPRSPVHRGAVNHRLGSVGGPLLPLGAEA